MEVSHPMAGTVLLMDYEPRSIARVRALLQGVGIRVVLARDGESGIRTFEETEPDLTLIQDMIPKKHGFDVCRELKQTELGLRSPIVLIAAVRRGRWREVMETGCDGWVEKPFDDEAFLKKVQEFIPEAFVPAALPRTAERLERGASAEAAPTPGAVNGSDWISIPVAFEEQEIDDQLDALLAFGTDSAPVPEKKTRVKTEPTRAAKPRAAKKTTTRKKKAAKKTTKKTAARKSPAKKSTTRKTRAKKKSAGA